MENSGKTGSQRQKRIPLNSLRPTQNLLPGIRIDYGMLIVEGSGKRYVKVLEVAPIPFFTMSTHERNTVLLDYLNWIEQSPKKWGYCLISEDTDNSELFSYIESLSSKPGSKFDNAKSEYLDWVKQLSKGVTSQHKVLLYFEYEENEDGITAKTDMEVAQRLNGQANDIRGRFAAIGLEVKQHQDENYWLYTVLYNLLNPVTRYTESLQKRITKVSLLKNALPAMEGKIADTRCYIAPMDIKITDPNYFTLDGKIVSVLYAEPIQKAFQTNAGWMRKLSSYGNNVSYTVHFARKPGDVILALLQKTSDIMSSLVKGSRKPSEAEARGNRFVNIDTFRQHLKQGYDFFNAYIIVAVYGDSVEEVRERVSKVKKDMKQVLVLRDAVNQQWESFLMMLPLGQECQDIITHAEQTLLGPGMCSMFPFTNYVIRDKHGAVFGIDGEGQMVQLDPFDTKKHKNANGIVTGVPGSGKTFTMNTLILHWLYVGIRVRAVLPQKGFKDYHRTVESVEGSFINFFPSSKNCVNFWQLQVPEINENSELYSFEQAQKRSILAQQVQAAKTFFAMRMRGRMNPSEKDRLEVHVTEMYEKFGITTDNDTVIKFANTGKPWPVFSDLYEQIKDDPLMEHVRDAMDPILFGNCKNLNSQTNVDMSNRCLMFDVNAEECAEMLPEYYYIAMKVCRADAERSIKEFVIIFADEVQTITKNTEIAVTISELFALLRGFGAGIWVATQHVEGLNINSVSADGMAVASDQTIAANADTKIFLATDYMKTRALREDFGLSERETAFLVKAARGQALVTTGGGVRVYMQVIASEWERRMFNTDPKQEREFARIEAERRRKQEKAAKQETT